MFLTTSIKNKQIKFLKNKFALLLISVAILFLLTFLPPSASVTVLFLSVLLVIIVWLVYQLLSRYDLTTPIQFNKWVCSSIVLAIVFSIAFVNFFISKEHFVYYWDYGNHWLFAMEYKNIFNDRGIYVGLQYLYQSILQSEYNYVPSLMLVLPMNLLGNSYSSYIVAIEIMYMLPAICIFILFINKIVSDLKFNAVIHLCFIIAATVLFTCLYSPMLRGLPDSIGLIPVLLILIIVYHEDFETIKPFPIISLIVLLLLLALGRRWYSFWVVGFFVSYGLTLILEILCSTIKNKSKGFKELHLNRPINIFIVGIAATFILYAFFKEFMIRNIQNDYGNIYAAYKGGNFLFELKALSDFYGLFVIGLAVIGAVMGLSLKKLRHFTLFLILQFFVTLILFLNVQSMSIQHYYLFSITIMILMFFGFYQVLLGVTHWANVKNINQKFSVYFRNGWICVLILLFSLNFGNVFFAPPLLVFQLPILSRYPCLPRQRTDLDAINELADYLNVLTESSEKTVYTLASSEVLNDDILRKIHMPDSLQADRSAIVGSSHVDTRDGFPVALFLADYVVVGDPVQYHLRPDDQMVIGLFANDILTGKLDSLYEMTKSFTLDHDVKALVYKKIKEYDYETASKYTEILKQKYPDYPQLYDVFEE